MHIDPKLDVFDNVMHNLANKIMVISMKLGLAAGDADATTKERIINIQSELVSSYRELEQYVRTNKEVKK